MRIFVSYARSDGAELAFQLVEELRSAGHDPWIDEEKLFAGATWAEEIEKELDRSDVVLALISRGSYESEICRAETNRAWRKGRTLIPVLVQPDADRFLYLESRQYVDFSDAGQHHEALAILLNDIEKKNGAKMPEAVRIPYVTVLGPPPPYVERASELKNLREILLRDDSVRKPLALVGMGGKGKTTLAKAVCVDPVVQAAFPDGVIWLTIGNAAGDLMTQLRELGKVLRLSTGQFDTPVAAKNQLRTALQEKAVLLVLDDVWKTEDVQTFSDLGLRCRVFLTTRNKGVAAALSAVEVELALFDDKEAAQLLAMRADVPAASLPPEAAGIIEFCRGLPLAIAMVGSMLRGHPSRWKTAQKNLSEAHLRWVAHGIGDYAYGSIMGSIDVSLEQLDGAERERYGGLGIFRKDEAIPVEALKVYWGVGFNEAQDTAVLISDLSLGVLDENDTLKLHHLQMDYLREEAGPQKLQEQHKRLVDAYAKICGGKWVRGPEDGYFFSHLAYHLDGASEAAALDAILFDYEWLAARLAASDAVSLSMDFRYGPSSLDKRKVQHALVLSSRALHADRSLLPSQLIGRLSDEEEAPIRDLLAQAERLASAPWLCPKYRSLIAPLGPIQMRLFGHEEDVKTLGVQNGSRLVSGSRDGTIQIWDLTGNAATRILRGHEKGVSALALGKTGHLVSSSWDKTIKIWDLESGTVVRTLAGHESSVLAVKIAPISDNAVSSGPDGSIRVWDLETGVEIRKMPNHSKSVFDLAVTPDEKYVLCVGYDESVKVIDFQSGALVRRLVGHAIGKAGKGITVTQDGRHAVSASFDGTLKVWDLSTGHEVRTLEGHAQGVNSVYVFQDGLTVLSGSDDRTMKLWDLETGKNLRTFYGHEGSVSVVNASPDGSTAFSGSRDNSVVVWNLKSKAEGLPRVRVPGGVASLSMPKNQFRILCGNYWGEMHYWDLENPEASRIVSGHEKSVHVVITADGRRAASWGQDNELRVWDMETFQELFRFPAAASWLTSRIAISEDGRRAALADGEQMITWDLEKGRRLAASQPSKSFLAPIHFTFDGVSIVVPSDDSLTFYDAETHDELHSNPACGHVEEFALSRNGRLITFSNYGNLFLWDITNPDEPTPLLKDMGQRQCIDITSDGTFAVSAGDDRLIRVWDVERRKTLATFATDGELCACAITDNGQVVVAAERSGIVYVLELMERNFE